MPSERLVVCLGDSNTQGQFSANYVTRLQGRWPELQFVNAGVNGQLAYNIAQRLDDVVAQDPYGRPDLSWTLGFSLAGGSCGRWWCGWCLGGWSRSGRGGVCWGRV
jgi:hypothetical protein